MATSSAEVDTVSTAATISPTTSGTTAPATASTVDTEALITSEFDLTSTIAGYLDRHLVFPLLEFLQEQKIYAEEEMLRAKLELLSKTSMVDFAIRNYCLLNRTEEVPAAMREHREAVVHRLRTLQAEAAPLLAVLDNAEVVARLRGDKCFTMAHLMDNFSITLANLDALYSWAKLQFDIGKYPSAATYLAYYRALSNNAEKNASALWGKFAAEILMLNWEAALADMTALKDLIDAKSFASPIMQLQQRTWLIHWSLFVFFNHPNGRNGIIELFLQERYLNAIQTTCPHMLRYLTTAVITNKRKKPVLKELVKVIQQESYTYRDPITELLEALYVNFDFEVAQEKLRQCEKVLYNDFFLIACRDEFIENARLFIFETYCRIHQCIDIDRLALKLNMDQSAAEKWIVNLIRNARLDAKIDSAANNIIMGAQYPSVYQQVIEKTKGLTFKSSLLAQNIEKRQQAQAEKLQQQALP